jgi:kynurenine formamidase
VKAVWLSHVLNNSTPLYGGAKEISISADRCITSGDSCNTSSLKSNSHAGTHVDAPRHFYQDGRTVESYPPEQWFFLFPALIEKDLLPGQILDEYALSSLLLNVERTTDLLLIKTGFEKYRNEAVYWEAGPGLAASLASILSNTFPDLRAIGIDAISISSLLNRQEGHLAHEAFLARNILLFEDMSLCQLQPKVPVRQVIALPLRYADADGAPCSVVAWVDGS